MHRFGDTATFDLSFYTKPAHEGQTDRRTDRQIIQQWLLKRSIL